MMWLYFLHLDLINIAVDERSYKNFFMYYLKYEIQFSSRFFKQIDGYTMG